MQIICNHCGNQLSFPDYQNLVTCNHCATHLQIEETETTYTASVIDEKRFDELFTPNPPSYLIQTETAAPFFEKLTLEEEYTESLEGNRFRSLLSGKSLRPMLLRGFYRLFVSMISFLFGYENMPSGIVSIGFWAIFWFSYGPFIGIVSFRELKKWWRLFRAEQNYKIDSKIVTTEIDELLMNGNPPDALRRWYKRWLDSEKELSDIKAEFYYQKFIFKIPVGPPSVSKGLRLLVMVLPAFGFAVAAGFDNLIILTILFILLIIVFLVLGFSVMSDANNYQNTYESYLKERKKQLNWLRDYFGKG